MNNSIISIEVSVVSGSNESLIVDCLDSLFSQVIRGQFHISVTAICNTPGSDLPTILRSKYPNIHVVENIQRKGFAENHNNTMHSSDARYCLIVNDDIVFLEDCVQMMIDFMEQPENSNVAMVSPMLVNPDGTLQRSTYGFPSPIRAFFAITGLRRLIPFTSATESVVRLVGLDAGKSRFWAHDRTVDVDTFRGACVLGRMEAVRKIGVMHTVSLAGGEETEWHYRFKQHGWRIVFFVDAKALHYGSQTVKNEPRLRNESLKSYEYFFRIHRSWSEYVLFSLLTLIGLCSRVLWIIMLKRQDSIALDVEAVHFLRRSLKRFIFSLK